jgi:hypothetical protein
VLFDFGCLSLAQEMSFVDHHLPYFRQYLITRLLLVILPLFTESLCGDQLLASPPFSHEPTAFCPFCCMFIFSSMFIVQGFFFFLLLCRRLVCPGGYADLSQEWLWEYPHDAWFSPVGLLDVSQADLEPASGDTGALLFSQYKVV